MPQRRTTTSLRAASKSATCRLLWGRFVGPWMLAIAALRQVAALLARSEARHFEHRGGGRQGRPPRALPRVARAAVGQRAQRATWGHADRGAATLITADRQSRVYARRR